MYNNVKCRTDKGKRLEYGHVLRQPLLMMSSVQPGSSCVPAIGLCLDLQNTQKNYGQTIDIIPVRGGLGGNVYKII